MAIPIIAGAATAIIRKIAMKVGTSFLGNWTGQKVAKMAYLKWFKNTGALFEEWFAQYPKAYKAIERSLKAYRGYKKYYKLFSNPELIIRFLNQLPKEKVIEFERIIETITLTPKTKKVVIDTIQTQKKVVNKDKLKKLQEQQYKELNNQSEWVKLSSSWLEAGKYNSLMHNKVLGTLLIRIKGNPKIYAYPLVPYEVWVFMKNATGDHGSGAGTAFWRYWLRIWYQSRLREKVIYDLKRNRLSYNDHIDILSESTSRSTKSFYASKQSNYGSRLVTQDRKGYNVFDLNKDWYKNRSKAGYLNYVKQSELKLNKSLNTRIIYSSKNVYEKISYIDEKYSYKLKIEKERHLTTYGKIAKAKQQINKATALARDPLKPIKKQVNKKASQKAYKLLNKGLKVW